MYVVKLFIWYVAVCITYSHIPNKQLDDANKQRSSNSTKHERRPPEDGQTVVPDGTHTHRQHTATCQINNLTKQTSREVVTALSTKDRPLKMVKQL